MFIFPTLTTAFEPSILIDFIKLHQLACLLTSKLTLTVEVMDKMLRTYMLFGQFEKPFTQIFSWLTVTL